MSRRTVICHNWGAGAKGGGGACELADCGIFTRHGRHFCCSSGLRQSTPSTVHLNSLGRDDN